jgi:hypothetical protein
MYDLVADDRKNFLRPDPAKSQSRRLGEWELADLKIRDTLPNVRSKKNGDHNKYRSHTLYFRAP